MAKPDIGNIWHWQHLSLQYPNCIGYSQWCDSLNGHAYPFICWILCCILQVFKAKSPYVDDCSMIFSALSWSILWKSYFQHNLTCSKYMYCINACISRDIYPWTWYHTDNSSYTQVTPPGKKSVVSMNTWIDEYSIAPLIYHWYTNQFLCYSLDIIL